MSTVAATRLFSEQFAIAHQNDTTHLLNQPLFFESNQSFRDTCPTRAEECRELIMRDGENVAIKRVADQAEPAGQTSIKLMPDAAQSLLRTLDHE